MRKAAIGLGLITLVGLGVGLGANELTTAQDMPATPNQLLVCGTPFATPAASTTPVLIVDSTPMAGVGTVIASPGAVSSGSCTTEPS